MTPGLLTVSRCLPVVFVEVGNKNRNHVWFGGRK